jgi:carbon-monoxide dehydrogenase large subunit
MIDNTADPRSLRRTEDRRFLEGAARYIDDAAAPHQLYAAFVRSPYAHATIRAVDVTEALAGPGVSGVFTSADLIADCVGPIPCAIKTLASLQPMIVPPRHALALGVVRHVGEPVAMVVANSPAAARDAADRVRVEYDPLPAVTALGDALSPTSPQIWPEATGNLSFRYQRGDRAATQAAFDTAAHCISLDLVNNRVVAASMEPRGAIASVDPTGRLHLALSGQDVHGIRRDLASSFALAPEMIHVTCPDVGGGFGMKNVVHPEYIALLWAARRIGQPIRWTADRTEEFVSAAHGRDNLTTARLALDATGRILALDVATIGNLGAYVSSLGPGAHTTAPASAMGGLYAIPAIFMDARGVFTNTVPIDAYRGAGKPEANYIIERLIDAAALETNFDRIELRRINLIHDFPHVGTLGVTIDTGRFHDNLDAALLAADHEGFPKRRAEAAARGRLLGHGVACFLETSRGAPTERGAIRFHRDGSVDLLAGTQSNGQGLETSFAQMAAARLGLPIAAFRLLQGDTDRVAFGGGHGGARSLVMAGTAIDMAIDTSCAKAKVEAGRLLQAEPSDIRFAQGMFSSPDGASIGLLELVRALPEGALDADAFNPNDLWVFPNGCHVAEIEVDPQTGHIALRSYVAVDDYGVLVNPMLTEGQAQGGLAQGIGQAMLELVHYDPASGQLLTASFSDYALPRAADLPWLQVQFNEHPTQRNPLGAKGVGQAGAIAAPQTIIGAIADAIGIKHLDMPATPERVWQACRSARRS